jgi:hypothetical protein
MLGKLRFVVCFACVFLLAGCAPAPPRIQTNICSIFYQYPKWFWASQKTLKRWGVPISVQMAIIHQESHFHADAKPSRTKLLGFIPWARPTSAEGYAQAVNDTWKHYLLATRRNRASRSSFDAASDFVGWFAYRAHRRLGISRDNAYALYLAYHEGMIGYQEQTYRRKPWLIGVAHKVQYTADRYRAQLLGCEAKLPRHHWWNFF